MSNRVEGERVFCYQCENEWDRAHGGLTCPRCQSEFVEIVSSLIPLVRSVTNKSSETQIHKSQFMMTLQKRSQNCRGTISTGRITQYTTSTTTIHFLIRPTQTYEHITSADRSVEAP